VWVGELLVPYTETFRIYVDAYKTSQFEVILNGTTIVSNYFDSQTNASQPLSAYFSSNDIDLVQG